MDVGSEMFRIFPEGLIMASAFYALITFSFPFAVFSGSMVEAVLILRALKGAAQYLNAISPSTSAQASSPKCRGGFRTVTMESYTLYPSDYITPFPSTPLYMIGAALSYMLTSLSNLSKELEALGPTYSSRYYLSLMFSMLVLLAFMLFRMYNSCEGFFNAFLSVVVGLVVGGLLVYQNKAIFGSYGSNAVNMLGIPLLANRAANGQTLYLCPTTTAGRS
jgi:hypothetical protein